MVGLRPVDKSQITLALRIGGVGEGDDACIVAVINSSHTEDCIQALSTLRSQLRS